MEQKYVRDSIADDIRVDGRRRTEMRDFSLRLNVNPQARGSAQVRLGETCVMCFLYSEVSDTDPDAAEFGIAFSARVIAASDDVSPQAVATLTADLAQFFGRATSQSPACRGAIASVASRLFSGGVQPTTAKKATDAAAAAAVGTTMIGRCGVGVRIVAELSILCGAGGNLVGAAGLAVKSALWGATLPRVHITASAASSAAAAAAAPSNGEDEELVMEASAVEVDEKQRESIAAIAVAMPLVIKSVTTAEGFYCVDSLREEEAAAAFDCVVAVQTASMTPNRGSTAADASVSASTAAAAPSSSSSSNIVYSRFHSSKTTCELSVVDITTILSESAALAEQLAEVWNTKVA